MSIPKHIKEHLALGVTIGSSTRLSVGPGGTFSSIEDALTARAGIAHTLLASITATVTGTTAGTVSVQKAAKVGGDDLTGYVGREVYAQIGGAGPLIKMFIVSATELFSKYPFYADLTAEDFDLYEIKPVSIILQPGLREALTSALSVPSFTSIATLGLGSASLYSSGAGRLDISDANEVTIYGLQTNQAHNLASGVTLQAANTDMKTSMCDQITLRLSLIQISEPTRL